MTRFLTPNHIRHALANLPLLTFDVTDTCNLKCKYCGYGEFYNDYDERKNQNLPFESARQVLDYLADFWNSNRNISSNRNVYIGFYGGEPLLCFNDVIYPLSNRISNMCGNTQYRGSITTNGYLINPTMIEQFDKINLTNFQITLDGDEAMHNSIRFAKGLEESFSKIIENINLLSENERNTIMVRINYTKDTLANINNIAERFTSNAKKRITINFQQVWQDSLKQYVPADDNINHFKQLGFSVDHGSLI